MTRDEEIRANLYIEYEEYDCYWKEWKNDIVKTLKKYQKLLLHNNYSYCLESDFQFEKDYFEEINRKLEIVANENGLIIYQIM